MVDDLGTTGAVDSNSRTDDVEKVSVLFICCWLI